MGEGERTVGRQLDPASIERVRRFALRLTGDPDRAADVAQETALRVLERDTPHDLPYLFKVAMNLVRSEARRAWIRRRVPRDIERVVDGRLAGPDMVAEGVEDSTRVWQAVGRMPERERQALVMRVGESMTCMEIAEALGTTPNAVSCLVRRGKERLRSLLAEDDATPGSGRRPPRRGGEA